MQPCKTGDQLYSDPSPYSECSLLTALMVLSYRYALLTCRMPLNGLNGYRHSSVKICLHIPSYGPGSSPKHTIYTFLKLYFSNYCIFVI